MKISFSHGKFICAKGWGPRTDAALKIAGFEFDVEKKAWVTPRLRTAIRFKKHFAVSAQNYMNARLLKIKPWTGSLSVPRGFKLKDFQEEAAIFALSRNKSYLALDPGLGKGVIAAVIARTLRGPVFYVCPPALVENVKAELEKWSVPHYYIIPDSTVHRSEVYRHIKKTIALCMGYSCGDPLLVVDEAHRFKTITALRARHMFGTKKIPGIQQLFDRQVWMSGTPLENRPIELYPVLSKVAPETIDFMNMNEYGKKYCAGFEEMDFNGNPEWNYKGASNMDELSQRVKKTFMLRLRKEDVLKELPPKQREIILLGKNPPQLLKMERAALAEHSPKDLVREKMSSNLSRYRHQLGLLKVKPAAEYIRTVLEGTIDPLIVFAYHQDVIALLAEKLKDYKPLTITGNDSREQKQRIVSQFQDGESPLLIANYLAGGLGFTLTRAPGAIAVEWSWVPGQNEQFEDRIHRIGQMMPVWIHYLVYQNSLDRTLLETNFRKKRVTSYI